MKLCIYTFILVAFSTVALADAKRNTATIVTKQNPCSTVKMSDNVMSFDFGKASFGWLEIDAPAGSYTVRLGEKIKGDKKIDRRPGGTIRFAQVGFNSQGKGFGRVKLKADRRNTKGINGQARAYRLPRKYGVVMPFRYVEVEGDSNLVSKVKIRRHTLHWPINMKASTFKCDDERLNKVYDFCKYSIWATSFAGVYLDGDRERIPYEADAYINQLGHYAIDADFEMGRRTFETLIRHPTWPTEWAQHMIMMAWADWMYSGSKDLIQKYYSVLKSDKLLLNLAREDGLLKTFPVMKKNAPNAMRDIVDWPIGERDNFVFKDVNAVVNAFHYRNLNEMRDIANALGKIEDAKFFEARAKKVKKSFNKVFFNDVAKLYRDGEGTDHSSLHANAAALAFGLVPEAQRKHIADFLVKKGMACSVYFAQYLLEALFEAGRDEDAIKLMVSDSDRSWLGMMRQGSTVSMEAWSLKAKPNQDWNHAWGTPPLNIIVRYVLGVKPLKPGFAEYEVKPRKGYLKKVSGVVPTVKGPIVVPAE
jgi:hypothetical protein